MMKKQFFNTVGIVAISLLLLNAKSDKHKMAITASTIEQSVAKISETFYAGKYEVSNILYREFVNDLIARKRDKDLKISQVDSDGWHAKGIGYNEPYVLLYHRHPAYNDYPVVNISYEDAKLFCKWLTDTYNSFPKRKFNKVLFRLPTEQEWMNAARAGHPNQIFSSGDSLRNKKGVVMYNFNASQYFAKHSLKSDSSKYENADITAPCKSYWANDFGIYNMSGNAAEMLADKGITKGGSFREYEEALKIDAKETYQHSASNIGFRYFMEVIKE